MILMGTNPNPDKPSSECTASTAPVAPSADPCLCCDLRPAGHGHFGWYCEPCAARPVTGCDHGQPGVARMTAPPMLDRQRRHESPEPVIVSLREALGDAIDRRQVAILRAELDADQ